MLDPHQVKSSRVPSQKWLISTNSKNTSDILVTKMSFYLCKALYLILAAQFSILPLSLKPGDTSVTQSRIDLNNFLIIWSLKVNG